MAKKASKKKVTKKKATKKTAPVTEEEAVEARKAALLSGQVPATSRRPSMLDVVNTLDPETKASIRSAGEARAFREFRLFTGIVDFDLFCGVTFGKRIQIAGDPGVGKSLLQLVTGGAFHRTCRVCYTPILTWIDDWQLYQLDPQAWAKATTAWAEGKGMPFVTKKTCRCGACDPMSVLLIDAEDCFDPYWGHIWGMDVGNFEDYDSYDVDNVQRSEEEGGGTVWRGLKMSPDAKLLVCRPKSSTTIEGVVLPMIRSGAVDAILIDSLAAFAIEEDLQGNERIASRARFMRRFLPAVLSTQIEANQKFGAKVTVVATNQYMQGPKANAKSNPNSLVGGQAIKYQADQTMEIGSSKPNVPLGDGGWKEKTVTKDLGFRITKAKVSGSGGGYGTCRVYLDDFLLGKQKIPLRAGDTDEADKLYKYLGTLSDPAIYHETGKSSKVRWVLGRPFKRVKDVVAFLHRRDIQYQLRFLIYAKHMAVSGRLHLRGASYGFNPFQEDPAAKLIAKHDETVGESLRQVRGSSWDEPTGGDGDAEAAGDFRL